MRVGTLAAFLAAGLAGCNAGSVISSSSSPATASPTPLRTSAPTPAPTPAPASTPTPVATNAVYVSVGSPGVEEFSTAGTSIATFAGNTGANDVGFDDAGHAYVLADAGFSVTISRYAIGGQAPNASYDATSSLPQQIFVGPNGTLVAVGAGTDASGHPTAIYDFWDPGTTNAPSRTLTYTGEAFNILGGAIAADGTFYLPYSTAAGATRYDVIPAGASTPSRTIDETIAANGTGFDPSTMAVGADGTLYAGEWTFSASDPNAGLYVYPPSGSETRVTAGATNPTSIDFDAAGNVYVTNSNATLEATNMLSADTRHTLGVFTPHAARLMRTVTTGLDDPQDLAVDADGTAYIVDFANVDQTTSPIEVVHAGSSAAALFAATAGATNVVLFGGREHRQDRRRTR